MRPESIVICLALLKREKQRLLDKPIDPMPGNFPVESLLIALDEAAEDIKQELKDYPHGH